MADYSITPERAYLLHNINKLGVEGEADAIQMYYTLLEQAQRYLRDLQSGLAYDSSRVATSGDTPDGQLPAARLAAVQSEIDQVQDLINLIAEDIIPDEKDHLEKLRGMDDLISKIQRGG